MKYNHFKWYKVPKRGLRSDASGVAVLLKRGVIWYLSNAEVVSTHCHQLSATHFMTFPGYCNTWMGPSKLQDILNKL